MRATRAVPLLLLLLGAAQGEESLAGLLDDPDRGARYAAAMALGKAGTDLAAVVPLLDDPEWCVRQAAENAFALAGKDIAVRLLVPVLRTGSARARLEAAEALARLGLATTPPMLTALRDADPAVVVAVLDGIWHRARKERAAAAARIAPLLAAEHEEVSLMAALVLAGIDPAARERLQRTHGERHERWAKNTLERLAQPDGAEDGDVSEPRAPMADPPPLDAGDLPDVLRRWRSFRPDLASPHAAVRVASVRALGRRGRSVAAACRDRHPDVRAAAARYTDESAVLAALLDDADWRVRRNAVKSLGRVRAHAERIAPLLQDQNVAIAWAAFDALKRIGGGAAVPVARVLAAGNPAVLRFAPLIFARAGAGGAPAAGQLAGLLAHRDVNVREVAARCLAETGPAAAGAAPSLVKALEDRRLCVVAHAALALGRLDAPDPLRAALGSPRARVRAYAAFALGEVLGARRGLAPLPYEPRLPVLDAGGPQGVRVEVKALAKLPRLVRIRRARRGLWSSDPAVAIPCAAALDYDEMDARECERAVELLLPEALRPGSVVDFDRLRSYLGSSELGAFLEYFCRARTTRPPRDYVYAHLHRLPRSDDIPMLDHFLDTEDTIRRDGFGAIEQPYAYTARFPRDRSRLWRSVARCDWLDSPETWWLQEVEAISPTRAALLIDLARYGLGQKDNWVRASAWAALKALGAARDAASGRYLLHVAQSGSNEPKVLALCSLARRGSIAALGELVRESATNEEALGLLLESFPDLANAVLRARLADPAGARACGQLVWDALYHGYNLGVRVDPDAFLGIEPALRTEVLDADTLATIATTVPGCGTRRVVQAILDRAVKRPPEPWIDTIAHSRDPFWRFVAAVEPDWLAAAARRWSRQSDPDASAFGFGMLVALGSLGADSPDERVVEWLRKHPEQRAELVSAGHRYPGLLPQIVATARAGDGYDWIAVLDYQRVPVPGYESLTRPERKRFEKLAGEGRGSEWCRDMLRRHPELAWHGHDHIRPPWLLDELRRRLDTRSVRMHTMLPVLAVWPDADARADYWSIMRAGRYRWVADVADDEAGTLGWNLSTLVHWAYELESNCCRANPRPDGIFEELIDDAVTSSCYESGIGQPGLERVRQRFDLYGLPWRFRAR